MKLKYHEDPSNLHVNTVPTRSYYLPYSRLEYLDYLDKSNLNQNYFKMKPLTNEYSNTDRFYSLNGEWQFDFYHNLYEVEDGFYEKELNPKSDTIDVPSCIQIKGYDKHQYSNLHYPFPYDPPFVPEENPTAVYQREFVLTKEQCEYRQYLNFKGVDSCLYVWMNGSFVGYSQVSHSTSEFEITEFVKEGVNRIAVIVLKWCDGSYLEDQDKFRMTGIFRDVYILFRPKEHIFDYYINTEISNKESAKVKINLEYREKKVITYCTLYGLNGKKLEKKEVDLERSEIEFEIKKPQLWNAEDPQLYTIAIETEEEVIMERLGIRKIEVRNGVVYLNDVNIKMKGVNRHDSDPYTGYTISRKQAIKDMELMKQHNINAIRTSHYPNAPWFLQLCDEYGFYVIGESDIEAHSAACIYGGSQENTFGDIVQREIFDEAIMDRVKRNVIRDKNRPSIVIWSLGNEAGYSKSLEDAGRWVKEYDPSRLLQYESSIYETGEHKNDTSMLDLYTRMYASLETIDEYFENDKNAKPFLQIEFCHAMGNGPGDLEDYYEKIYQQDGFLGGFIWEWCDHAIYMGKTVEGKDKFYYGGDFGEFPNDGNFCVDGLVYPDRRVSTGLIDYKNVIRPIRATAVDGKAGLIQLSNKLDFTNVKDYVQVEYEITRNGLTIEKKILDSKLLDIKPHEDKIITFDYDVPKKGLCFLNIIYKQVGDNVFTKEGHILGTDQILILEDAPKNILKKDKKAILGEESKKITQSIQVVEDDKYIILRGSDFHYTLNKWTACFEQMNHNNKKVINHPMEFNIYRAPTDNDIAVKWEWKNAGYDRKTVKVYEVTTKEKEDEVLISCKLSIGAIYIQRILDIQVTYQIDHAGSIHIHTKASKNMELPFLPRFGFRFFLAKEYSDATYYGYGPYESYVDKRRASYFGRFHEKVENMHEDYVKPQENSSHYGCRGLILEGKYETPIFVHSKNEFSMNVSRYTWEELEKKGHNYELEPSDSTVLCLDYKMSGIGSQSCGPRLQEKYQLNDEEMDFQFTMEF